MKTDKQRQTDRNTVTEREKQRKGKHSKEKRSCNQYEQVSKAAEQTHRPSQPTPPLRDNAAAAAVLL